MTRAVFACRRCSPGWKKSTSTWKRRIATPRYEVHGWSLEGSLQPAEPSPESAARRDTAARVLLASAKGAGDYSLQVNTFQRDNTAAAFQLKVGPVLAGRYQKVAKALAQFGNRRHADARKMDAEELDLRRLVKEGLLKQADALDPWGTPMKIVDATWCPMCQTFHNFSLASAGIDGQWGTLDDLTYRGPSQRVAVVCPRPPKFQGSVGGRGGFNGMGGMGGFGGGQGGFAPAKAQAEAASRRRPHPFRRRPPL